MEPGGGDNFTDVLSQMLQKAKLYDMLNVMANAADMNPNELINGNTENIQKIINEQIVRKFITILQEVQKIKAEQEDDAQFHDELANDIVFDIPEVFPMQKTYDNPDIMDNINEGNDELINPSPPVAPIQQPPEQQQQQQPQQQQQEIPKQKPSEPAMSPHDQLKALYAKEEAAKQMRHKIKLKLKVGFTVDIYSASKKLWVEGIIKEIKGDVLCVVYGKKMKWLKKDSKQLRPKAQLVKQAVNQYSQ